MIRCYSDLISLQTFEERFEYLKLNGSIGIDTFGFDRYMNQMFYKSKEWNSVRSKVIARDLGCDLGVADHEIFGRVVIHHMNPITPGDIEQSTEFLLNPEYLITVSSDTHNAIHYGYDAPKQIEIAERRPNDTSPWKKQ